MTREFVEEPVEPSWPAKGRELIQNAKRLTAKNKKFILSYIPPGTGFQGGLRLPPKEKLLAHSIDWRTR